MTAIELLEKIRAEVATIRARLTKKQAAELDGSIEAILAAMEDLNHRLTRIKRVADEAHGSQR